MEAIPTALAVAQDTSSPVPVQTGKFDAEQLISTAIEKNVPVETMERLLAMRKDLRAEAAKEDYDRAMAAFQAECPTIAKTKEVKTKSGQVAYRYAPIDSIVEQVKLPLQRNGFSYSTNMELLPTGVKVSVKTTHSGGHSEVTEMTVPLGTKTDIMSASQVVAAAQTFAKRYAFCNAFGIMTGDEDNDAVPQDQQAQGIRQETYPDGRVKANPSQATYIMDLIKRKQVTEAEAIAKHKEVKYPSNLIRWLDSLPDKVPAMEVIDVPATQTESPTQLVQDIIEGINL